MHFRKISQQNLVFAASGYEPRKKKKGGGNMRIRGFLPEFHFSELEFVVRVELSTDKAQGGRHDLEENWFLFFSN
jgi:hypothetical protein